MENNLKEKIVTYFKSVGGYTDEFEPSEVETDTVCYFNNGYKNNVMRLEELIKNGKKVLCKINIVTDWKISKKSYWGEELDYYRIFSVGQDGKMGLFWEDHLSIDYSEMSNEDYIFNAINDSIIKYKKMQVLIKEKELEEDFN